MIEVESDVQEPKVKERKVRRAKPPAFAVYVSNQKEQNEFKIIGIRPYRSGDEEGHCFWKVPNERVEAFEINHFFATGRVVKWTP